MATTATHEIEIGDGELVGGELDTSALSAYVAAEIDVQIATAKKYPRSITRFKRAAMELACLDEETAASMFYKLPRDGKKIEGPSVRLAEIVGSSWGNLRYGARVISIDDRFLTAQGACHDLETNNAATVEIRRRITKKDGKRYSDDMIQTTANAACSIALRQAIFKIVPFALIKDIYQRAKETSVGKAGSTVENRRRLFDWFIKAGADDKSVLAYLGKSSLDDVNMDDMIDLKGLITAIKDGEVTIEEALAVRGKNGSNVSASDLNDKLKTPSSGKPAVKPAADENGTGSAGEALTLTENDLADYWSILTSLTDTADVAAAESTHLGYCKNEADKAEVGKLANKRRDEIKKTRGSRSNKPGELPGMGQGNQE